MENRCGEYRPAEKLVTPQRKGTGSAGPGPNGKHAQDEAARHGAEA